MNKSVSVKTLTHQLTEEQPKSKSSILTRLLKQIIINQLSQLQYGQLNLRESNKVTVFSGKKSHELKAEIDILNDEFYWYVAFAGGLGAGEAYICHFWKTPDLTKVIQLFAVNQQTMDSMENGLARFTTPLKKFFHWLNKNTLSGSKSNILAHYDLGNDFFKLFLDPTMMYSSGIFYHANETMQQASENKLKRICDRLKLNKDDKVIEIGTGWGSFAIFAAKNYGCHVTTTTISEEQYAYACKQVKDKGLEDQITLLKKDYRELTGQFDKLVSIEMIEAVGHQYFDVFFKKCDQLLKPDGQMLLQAITIVDQRFDTAKSSIDFIKRYVFPGSCIPSLEKIGASVKKATQMRVLNLDDIGLHYAKTLNHWRQAFLSNIHHVKKLGFSDDFIRMWEYYLCYCEGGFKEQVISTVQLHLAKPRARVISPLSDIGA